jgi:hypothetical protein
MRPAEVWGWMRKPSSSRWTSSLRIVAVETSMPERSATRPDPTELALSIYS